MSFDTLAPRYRGLEFVTAGAMLQRCRTTFLAETARSRRALILGEGPGRFLVALLRINPNVAVTWADGHHGPPARCFRLERVLSSRMQTSRTQWLRLSEPPQWPRGNRAKQGAQPGVGA